MIEFTIYSTPVPQGRPRFTKIKNFVKAYDPKESRSWKDTVKAQAIDSMVERYGQPRLLDGPLHMFLHFYFARPKSHYGSGRNAHLVKESAPKHHTSKPDLDNLGKAIKDALKGLCYKDDSQVCLCILRKYYDDQPRVEVTIKLAQEGDKVHVL